MTNKIEIYGDCYLFNGLFFRWIRSNYSDAMLVTKWRNTKLAKESFFDTRTVTPYTHLEFIRNKKPHDLVWMMEERKGGCAGMTSITVDVDKHTAEYGRLYIDDAYQGKGYGTISDTFCIFYSFKELNLDTLWCDVLSTNTRVIALHIKTGYKITQRLPHVRGEIVRMVITRDEWAKHYNEELEA